jgi:hypothetical protein
MIPRKIGRLPDQRGFNTVRGNLIMAMNKTAGVTKKTAKKAVKSTAKKAAPKKAAGAAKKKSAPKKKAAGPKLSPPQAEMLKKVAGIGPGSLGYHADKKPENKTLETLLKHKLVKKGKKHAPTGFFHYQVTKAGQKHLQTSSAPAGAPKSS